MTKRDFLFILFSFLIWRIALFVFVYIGVTYLPLQQNFLGGGKFNYDSNPWLWSFINFDGEHYLSIAQSGYQPLTHFYFPAFPILSRAIASFFGGGILNLAVSGIVISHISFFIALLGIWKLLEGEFGKRLTRLTLLLLLFFPTSYYFASYYTESLFLSLIVWSFYFAKKKKWLLAGILGGISTATRIIGVALSASLFIEMWKNKQKSLIGLIGVLLSLSGIGIYMWYLNSTTGDPLEFFNTVSIFGDQRSSRIILLPQVFYRYFVRILPYINFSYLPGAFTFSLELVVGILFAVLSVLSFWKLKLHYAIFIALGYIIPTLSGSFSSLPRYVVILFPAFVLMAMYVDKFPKPFKIALFAVLFVGLGLATSLFVRGYWIS